MKIRLKFVQEECLAFSVNAFSDLWLRAVNIHRFGIAQGHSHMMDDACKTAWSSAHVREE